MIILSDLNRLAGEHYPGRHVTLPCVLRVWAQTDPGASRSGARGIARLLERELLQPVSLALLMREKEEEIQVALGEAYYAAGRVELLTANA